MEITIRKAVKDDAAIIGCVVAMAIGMDGAEDYAGADAVRVLTEVAEREDSQYSYRNALVAEADGRVAGAVVGYDGARLAPLRDGSLTVIRKYHPDLEVTADETGAGEFYLDSLGVLPEFRGCGIGSLLMDAMMEQAAAAGGHRCFGLLVDPENPGAERLYRSKGFMQVGETPFFGHMMKHMQKKA